MDIQGDKVILRLIEEQDQQMLQSLIHDSEIVKITKGYASYASYDHQMNWSRFLAGSGNDLHRIIAHKEARKNGLGIIILSHVDFKDGTAEIYIKLMKSARKQGYGQDAVMALVSYGFRELNLSLICSHILESNVPSRKLFEKCGFRQEGVDKSRRDKDGGGRNVCIYAIRNEGYCSHRSAHLLR